jgi:hypothetical protein
MIYIISPTILFFVARTRDHFWALRNTRHTRKTTQTAVTSPEALVCCTPGPPQNKVTHVSVPGHGTFLT